MKTKDRLLLTLVPPLGAWLIRLFHRVWRFKVNDPFQQSPRVAKGSRIYCFWHGVLLPATVFNMGGACCVMVSRNKDGELIARVLDRLGFPPAARGSSSRGGATALLAMAAEVRKGFHAGFTPDGPRGPYHVAQSGALQLAKMTGVPIVAVGLAARPAFKLSNWDRFLVPLPFARCAVEFGRPQTVQAGFGQRKLESLRRKLQRDLNVLTRNAEKRIK